MDLLPTDEQEQIIDAARGLLGKELPVESVRWDAGALAVKDRVLIPTFAELGWFGLGLPEERGGIGFGAVGEMLLFREAGRHLVTPILLAGVIAARIAPLNMVGEIVAGNVRVGLAIAHEDDCYLIDAADANLVVLVAPDSLSLFALTDFDDRRDLRGIDGTVTFQTASRPSRPALAIADSAAADYLSLLLAAMLCGNAEAVRDISVAHACERAQFGQKIGTFQAVSHPIAEMAVRCEAAFAQVKYAAVTVASERADAEYHTAAALIIAVQAALENARVSIQLHGGMGFAAEYPINFYLKRAHLLDQIGGRSAVRLDRFIAMDPD